MTRNRTWRKHGRTALVALISSLALSASAAFAAERKPNILLIVADDLGYSDIAPFGGEIDTPTLDQLANEGVRLTDFYAQPFCAPTRASLMTGLDNHLAGFGDQIELVEPQLRGTRSVEGYLPERAVPLPQLLRDAGYQTYIAGKWHLGMKPEAGPDHRGFDQSYVVVSGGSNHFEGQLGIVALDPTKPPKALTRENGAPVDWPEKFYSTNFFTDKMIEYIEDGRKSGKPFFGYLAYTSPHWPLQAPEEDIQRYLGKYDVGYDAIQNARLDRMKSLGIIEADATAAPAHPHWLKWEELGEAERRSESKRMAVYAAMVDNLDQNIRRMLAYLESVGELDNTLIVFMSDNGADGNSIYDVERTREWIYTHMDNSIDNIGRKGSYVDYGPSWARVSMTPFRGHKAFLYEGGVSVPVIAWGPKLGVEKGAIKRERGHVTDLAPTLLEFAGTSHPRSSYKGREVLPLQGKSLAKYLRGQQQQVRSDSEYVGFELGGRKALIKGDWKIVQANKPWGTSRWELYDLKNDRAETNDLAARYPEKVAELRRDYAEFVAKNDVLEIDGLAYRPGYSNAGLYYEDLRREAAAVAGKPVGAENMPTSQPGIAAMTAPRASTR